MGLKTDYLVCFQVVLIKTVECPSLSAIFFCQKMANEDASLLFTRRQPLFTQKAQPFLHIFTYTKKPCL